MRTNPCFVNLLILQRSRRSHTQSRIRWGYAGGQPINHVRLRKQYRGVRRLENTHGMYAVNSQPELESSVSVRSYMAEMHNDGLFFLEQARQATNEFVKRRFLRASIIYFCSSVEATISKIVYDRLNENEYEDGHVYAELKAALNDPGAVPPERFRAINGKLSVVENLFGRSIPRRIKIKFKKLTIIRNKIIHFSVPYTDEVYATGEIERIANEAPDVVDNILSVMFGYIGLYNGFPKNRSSRY